MKIRMTILALTALVLSVPASTLRPILTSMQLKRLTRKITGGSASKPETR